MTLAVVRPCGIWCAQPEANDVYLPLERAEVHAEIIDGGPVSPSFPCIADRNASVSAIITITQHFLHYAPNAVERAKYVFPVPARSAVCAFKMTAPDGTVIAAVAKEKDQAKREHENAISQGFTTALVEHVSDDSELRVFSPACPFAHRTIVFSISLGALPAQQSITTEITVSSLTSGAVLCANHVFSTSST